MACCCGPDVCHRWVVGLSGLARIATRKQPLVRLTVDLGPEATLPWASRGPSPRTAPHVVLSPDGSRIAFIADRAAGPTYLFTRRLDQSKATRLDDTEEAAAPFFSPDGRWIGFFAKGRLKKVSVEGGGAIDLCPAPGGLGASWANNGFIVAALSTRAPLYRVPIPAVNRSR